MRMRSLVAIVGLMTGSGMPIAAAEGRAAEVVTVRTYDAFGVAPPRLAAARLAATTILGGADLRVTWLACAAAAGVESPCSLPVKPHEVAVRIVSAPPEVPSAELGSALVDLVKRSGALATIYEDHIEAVAARAHGDPSALLGRTIAHEIGHLLLGTSDHAGGGVMRGRWMDREVRGYAVQDWAWSPSDVALMHRHLLAPGPDDDGSQED